MAPQELGVRKAALDEREQRLLSAEANLKIASADHERVSHAHAYLLPSVIPSVSTCVSQGGAVTFLLSQLPLVALTLPSPLSPRPQALAQLQQAQAEMAAARAEAEASRKLVASEASHLESRAASVQASVAAYVQQLPVLICAQPCSATQPSRLNSCVPTCCAVPAVQAEAAAATEQRISMAAKLRDVEQREVRPDWECMDFSKRKCVAHGRYPYWERDNLVSSAWFRY